MIAVTTTRKITSDGGHYLATSYSYDPTRKEFVDRFFQRGEDRGLSGDQLFRYTYDRFLETFGKNDYYVNQLAETITRKMNKRKPRHSEAYDALFDALFLMAVKAGLRYKKESEREKLTAYLKEGLIENFGEGDYDTYIDENIRRKLNNYSGRKRRFFQKTYLNPWTHFITVTYDDEKFSDENEFRRALKRTLNNFHTRRGWKYMGVFERGNKGEEYEGRLHLHALAYIPAGQLPGTVGKVLRYNFKKKRMVETHENSYFKEAYGINDFKSMEGVEITTEVAKKDEAVNYILKYMLKDDENIVYSRAVPAVIYKEVESDDIITDIKKQVTDFVDKYVLFDDVISDDEPNGPAELNSLYDLEPPEPPTSSS